LRKADSFNSLVRETRMMSEDMHSAPSGPSELVKSEISAAPEGRVLQLVATWQVGKQDRSLIQRATTLPAETKSVAEGEGAIEQLGSVKFPRHLTAPLPHKRLERNCHTQIRALDDHRCSSQREDSFRMLSPRELSKLLQDCNFDHNSQKDTAVADVCLTSATLASVQPRRACNMFVVGIVGGATGAMAGMTAGAVLGVPSAILTLGLSVPICSGAGAAAGFGAGCIAGASAGFNGTNITVVYEDQLALAPAWQLDRSGGSRLAVSVDFNGTQQGPNSCNRRHTITLASAVGGSVVMGSLGGASGTAVGGVVGATIGLIQAPFTLGLSIPISTTIGTSMGFLTGTLAGASAGFFGGGITAKVLSQCCKH